MTIADDYAVSKADKGQYEWLLLNHHYAARVPGVSFAYKLTQNGAVVGVITFGVPASRHLQKGACPTQPNCVIELNRLCVLDECPKNIESWFIAQALSRLPPFIVVSYADTMQGHMGIVYRAANFRYAGWTDMDRKTPRFDYVVPGKHSRQAFRGGVAQFAAKVRRKPKMKYWTVTGTKIQKISLLKICALPQLNWKTQTPTLT